MSEWTLRELWQVVSGGVDDEAGTRRWAKQLRPGQINQEDPSQVSEGVSEGVKREGVSAASPVLMCVCVWLVSVEWVDSAHVGGYVWSRGSDEGAAAGGG